MTLDLWIVAQLTLHARQGPDGFGAYGYGESSTV